MITFSCGALSNNSTLDSPRETKSISEINQELNNAIQENKTMINDNDVIAYESLAPIIIDNPHIDYEALYDRIEKLNIQYGDPMDSPYQAEYFSRNNNLVYYSPVDNTYSHEAVHVIYPASKLPRYIQEGLALTLPKEFITNDVQELLLSDSNKIEAAFKMLCELVDENIILEAAANNDPSIIIDELEKIHGTKEYAEKIFYSLCPLYEETNKYKTPDSLIKILKPYFIAKYGEEWLEKNEAITIYEYNFTHDGSEVWPDKYYFNDEYIKIK